MIRYVLMAVLFGALGAGGASVDWQSRWDYVVAEWEAPPDLVDVSSFFYYRQCNNCYNLWHDKYSLCCEGCGAEQFANIRARKIEHHGDWWRGYQTTDGLLYIDKEDVWWFNDQFVVGSDVYQKTEAIIAKNAKLR